MTESKRATNKAGYKYNWVKLQMEYLLDWDISLNAYLKKHGIPQTRNTYNHTNGWVKKRNDWQTHIMEYAKKRMGLKMVNGWEQRWDAQMKLWKAVETEADRILKASQEGMILKSNELASLTVALQNALKSQKLICGEPTEKIEEKRSIHLEVVQLIGEIESGQDKEYRRPILENPESI